MMTYRVECIRLQLLSDIDRHDWSNLGRDTTASRVAFLSPTFCDAVSDSGADIRVIVIRRQQQAAFIPIQFKKGILGTLRVAERVGGELSDYFGAVASPGFRVDIEEVMRDVGVSAITFSHLDESQSQFGLFGESPRIGLRTRIGLSGDDFWGQLSLTDRKLTADTERRKRKLLAEHGPISFELSSSSPERDLDILLKLKFDQYTRTERRGAQLAELASVRTVRKLLLSHDPLCSGLLSVLRAGNRLIAAHFGLRCAETLHYWIPAYDIAFDRYSPGRLLLTQIIQESPQIGILCIDRGEGNAPFKKEFANQEHRYFRGVWRAKGILGAIGQLALSAAWRMKTVAPP